MFYQSVVLKEGDVIYGGLDSKNQAKLIIHLYGNRTHGVLDPGSLDACIEVIAHLTLVILMELSAKEGGDIVRFHGVNGGAGEMPVD